jgi:hypothetical protein
VLGNAKKTSEGSAKKKNPPNVSANSKNTETMKRPGSMSVSAERVSMLELLPLAS